MTAAASATTATASTTAAPVDVGAAGGATVPRAWPVITNGAQ
jgi:hypothetical protein